MVQLKISSGMIKLHTETYADAICAVLKDLALGRPVFKMGKGRRVVRWVSAPQPNSMRADYFRNLCCAFRRYDFLTVEPHAMEWLVRGYDKWCASLSDNQRLDVAWANSVMTDLFNYDKFGRGSRLEYQTQGQKSYIRWVDNHDVWGAWHYLKGLNVRSCCYCNAETVFSLLLDQKRPGVDKLAEHPVSDFKRSALDHYYAHSKYPFLGISLYNLIPACTRCNTNIKGARPLLRRKHVRPFEESFDDGVRFMAALPPGKAYCDLTDDDVVLSVERFQCGERDLSLRALNTAGFFHLNDVYNQLHRWDAANVIRKVNLIPDEYRKLLLEKYPLIDKVVLDRMLWNVSLRRQDINQYRLSKLTLDLLEQFGVRTDNLG